ncbi:MAG: Maf family protein [bacterium]
MIKNKTKIILASTSPRRKAMLKAIGLNFITMKPATEEEKYILPSLHKYLPSEIAITLAREKAHDVEKRLNGQFTVISADTIVTLDGRIIGKPSNKKDAARILKLLRGRTHHVITGVCVLKHPEQKEIAFSVTTDVTMLKITDREIESYVKTGEPMDKAGAYGIQGLGGIFIKSINGSYTNVVGLPLTELITALKRLKVIEIE